METDRLAGHEIGITSAATGEIEDKFVHERDEGRQFGEVTPPRWIERNRRKDDTPLLKRAFDQQRIATRQVGKRHRIRGLRQGQSPVPREYRVSKSTGTDLAKDLDRGVEQAGSDRPCRAGKVTLVANGFDQASGQPTLAAAIKLLIRENGISPGTTGNKHAISIRQELLNRFLLLRGQFGDIAKDNNAWGRVRLITHVAVKM
jgi:hypothetical protein